MQKAPVKSKRSSGRKSGRVTFDKSGRSVWEWRTSTGVFEQVISDSQLTRLEDSQLTFLDQPPTPSAVSYYEFRERTNTSVVTKPAPKQATPSPIKRLFSRFRKD